MAAERNHVCFRLPAELAKEIDALVGPRKRGAFIRAAAEQEIRRRKLAASRSPELQAREASERRSIN
jgi:metal-responsive CopG/Arc/MetJ family transcriptional regulator